ncbi:MAG: NAD-dependent epimerase/dehydratase family protein [Beduini sp.]|uniref:NAD-dependent epimerase/dehydratase family protein n=1 Tax=Beduini sp. TaxID=1922300 RepID=UPI0039A18192
MKRILITGSNGFVGKHLMNCLSNSFEVYGIDRCQPVEDNYHFTCDITEKERLKNLYKKINPEVIIHLAAIVHKNNADTSEENYNFINYECSKFLFDLAVENKAKVIFASTIEVYGESEEQFIDEGTVCKPESYYAKSKYKAEEYLRELPIEYSILRFVPLYGEEFTLNVDKRVYLKKDKLAYYFKDGKYTFDFCHIENVCKAIRYLCEQENKSNTYILADQKAISAKEIIETNKKKKRIRVIKVPYYPALLAISILDWCMRSKKDFYFSKRNFKKLFQSKHYSSKKINLLVQLNANYEGMYR